MSSPRWQLPADLLTERADLRFKFSVAARAACGTIRYQHRFQSCRGTSLKCLSGTSNFLRHPTSSPQRKLPPNLQAEHLLGTLVCVSNINQTRRQSRNCSRPSDITRSPPVLPPNRGCDNSKSLSTTACAVHGSGGR